MWANYTSNEEGSVTADSVQALYDGFCDTKKYIASDVGIILHCAQLPQKLILIPAVILSARNEQLYRSGTAYLGYVGELYL